MKTGQSLWINPTLSSPGTSAAVKTATTPGMALAASGFDPDDIGAGVIGQAQGTVQHAVDGEIVDEAAVAESELGALVFGAFLADPPGQGRFGNR